MQKNNELQQLFSNYRNLSEEQLDRLIALVVKQEKEKLGLSLPVELKIDYDELTQNSAGGDSTLDFDEKTNQYHYTIRLNGNEWYKQYLANRNQIHQNGTMTFESSLDSLYNLIARVCHEMRHAYQNEQTHMRSDLSNPEALVWLKQELVIPDEDFYRESHNYSNMPREVDAFNYQYQEALDYIRSYTTIERDNPEFFATLQSTLNRNQKENVRPLDELTFIVNGEEIKATEYFNQNMSDSMIAQGITPEIIENSILRYEYNSDYSKKTLEQLMSDKQKMIDGLDSKLPNYIHVVKKIEAIYDSIISNDIDLQKGTNKDNQNSGYSIEKNGTSYVEKQQQVLKDYSGKEIGNRTITWNTDMQNGTESIETIGTLENSDGKYSMKETSETFGGELQLYRKELTNYNKNTGENEQYIYQKDKDGNEMFYRIADGQLTCKIKKNSKGTTIDYYDKGQITDSFEYDENGKALIGMEGMEQLDKNYVENLFDTYVPYFYAENRELQTQGNKQSDRQTTVDTQRLGKETLDMQKDTRKLDEVEQQINMQMREQTQQKEEKFEINEFGEIIRPENTQRSFRESMRFDVSSNEYAQETLRKFTQDLENGTLENEDFKKKDSHKVEKGDDDYVM